MNATIEIDGLRKRFGPVQALDGMTFTVQPGHVTGFVGPNGAGSPISDCGISLPGAHCLVLATSRSARAQHRAWRLWMRYARSSTAFPLMRRASRASAAAGALSHPLRQPIWGSRSPLSSRVSR
jgi:hypothetical protein